ncbi:hypothetical protein B0T16DRAFT_492325 [Cercophora newfieldiana]|uniref:Uncharacterized protein n=1 Tax=Cercophora newfieldiana TaxID=92897 RepID=A0AA39YCG7_9PEZI|nr:hypothetical protein B0T16DRAFT_492325 [Cercophora newfieldiana]
MLVNIRHRARTTRPKPFTQSIIASTMAAPSEGAGSSTDPPLPPSTTTYSASPGDNVSSAAENSLTMEQDQNGAPGETRNGQGSVGHHLNRTDTPTSAEREQEIRGRMLDTAEENAALEREILELEAQAARLRAFLNRHEAYHRYEDGGLASDQATENPSATGEPRVRHATRTELETRAQDDTGTQDEHGPQAQTRTGEEESSPGREPEA